MILFEKFNNYELIAKIFNIWKINTSDKYNFSKRLEITTTIANLDLEKVKYF